MLRKAARKEEKEMKLPSIYYSYLGYGAAKFEGETKDGLALCLHAVRVGKDEPDNYLNLARVYLAQGTVQDKAIAALDRAARFDPPAPSWSVAWFTGLVNKQNGYLDDAINNFESIVALDDVETRSRGFDFSRDSRLLNELGQPLYQRAKQERGETHQEQRQKFLREAVATFRRVLELDPSNDTSSSALPRLLLASGEPAKAVKVLERDRDQLAGNVKRGGLVEKAFGVTVRELIEEYRPVYAIDIALSTLGLAVAYATIVAHSQLALLLIAPLAFFMGMPFPLGLKRLSASAPGFVPWAWGINGFASVVSAVLATLLAIEFGFQVVIVLALVFYVLAAWDEATSRGR